MRCAVSITIGTNRSDVPTNLTGILRLLNGALSISSPSKALRIDTHRLALASNGTALVTACGGDGNVFRPRSVGVSNMANGMDSSDIIFRLGRTGACAIVTNGGGISISIRGMGPSAGASAAGPWSGMGWEGLVTRLDAVVDSVLHSVVITRRRTGVCTVSLRSICGRGKHLRRFTLPAITINRIRLSLHCNIGDSSTRARRCRVGCPLLHGITGRVDISFTGTVVGDALPILRSLFPRSKASDNAGILTGFTVSSGLGEGCDTFLDHGVLGTVRLGFASLVGSSKDIGRDILLSYVLSMYSRGLLKRRSLRMLFGEPSKRGAHGSVQSGLRGFLGGVVPSLLGSVGLGHGQVVPSMSMALGSRRLTGLPRRYVRALRFRISPGGVGLCSRRWGVMRPWGEGVVPAKGSVGQADDRIVRLGSLVSNPLTTAVSTSSVTAEHCLDCLVRLTFRSCSGRANGINRLHVLRFGCRDRSMSNARRRRMGVPLLALIPLPLLRMGRTSFSFSVRVISTLDTSASTAFSLGGNTVPRRGATRNIGLEISVTSTGTRNSHGDDSRRSLATGVGIGMEVRRTSVPKNLTGLLRLAAGGLRVRTMRRKGRTGRSRWWTDAADTECNLPSV